MRLPNVSLLLPLMAILSSIPTLAGEEAKQPGLLSTAQRADLVSLANSAESELKTDILPFWIKHAPDREHGGFFGLVTNDLTVFQDAPRGMLLTARILWTFSSAYRKYQDPQYLEMARWAYADLESRFRDKEQDGYFWSVKPDGTPVLDGKQIHGQAFAIYALSEFYRATGEKPALDRAIEVYRLIEKHSRDRQHGGYLEAFTRDWKRPPGKRLNETGPECSKSQSTHIHLIEAYANLLRAWPDAGLRSDLKKAIEVMLTHTLNKSGKHLVLYFDADWSPRSEIISFGHDMEVAWLLTDATEAVGDPELLKAVNKTSLALVESTLAEGLDKDGSVFFTTTPKGISDDNKEWWVQAEAAVGFINAYQISGDARYLAAAQRVWDFVEKFLIDRKNGEWVFRVTKAGKVASQGAKISMWKCPYHNGRACMEIADRIRAITGGEK
ncbi:MAG: AGE family epimerase/isomerase [Opitutaceae bacterium]